MARLHGRNARLYMAVASGGTPQPIAFLDKWTINFTVADADVTAFGDSNKVYVAGLPDAAGSFTGFYDDATAQMYTAASDGVARAFYLYTNTTTNLQYWFGNGLFDFQVDAEINNAVKISGSFKAATAVNKQG